MALPDLDQARAIHAALMALFVAEPGGDANPQARERVERLCDAAIAAVDDLECRVAMRGIKSVAVLLYSGEEHADIEAGALRGVEALRFRLLNALSEFRGRLEVLERRPPSRPEVPALSAKKKLSVLVVEDNADSAESLRRLLELLGYDVTVAHDGKDGLEAALRLQPEVVLCDIGLPDTDGFALAAALRENPATASVRLIAVTAYGEPADRERALQAGFDAHLVKPVEPGRLLRHLEDARLGGASSGERVVDLAAVRKPPAG